MKPIKNGELSKDVTDVIDALGFELGGGNGKYIHPLLPGVFDFSSCSVEGIPYVILHVGAKLGRESALSQIRASLGM